MPLKRRNICKRKASSSDLCSDDYDSEGDVHLSSKRQCSVSESGTAFLLERTSRQARATAAGGCQPISERQQLVLLRKITAAETSRPKATAERSSQACTAAKRAGGSEKINKRNSRGETKLHKEARQGKVEQTKELIEQGADVNIRDNAGWTPLHEACLTSSLEVIDCLLRAGAEVNAVGGDNLTPLHDAAANGCQEVIELLLQYGANPLLKDSSGKTALDCARNEETRNRLSDHIQKMTDAVVTSSLDISMEIDSAMSQCSLPKLDSVGSGDEEMGDDLHESKHCTYATPPLLENCNCSLMENISDGNATEQITSGKPMTPFGPYLDPPDIFPVAEIVAACEVETDVHLRSMPVRRNSKNGSYTLASGDNCSDIGVKLKTEIKLGSSESRVGQEPDVLGFPSKEDLGREKTVDMLARNRCDFEAEAKYEDISDCEDAAFPSVSSSSSSACHPQSTLPQQLQGIYCGLYTPSCIDLKDRSLVAFPVAQLSFGVSSGEVLKDMPSNTILWPLPQPYVQPQIVCPFPISGSQWFQARWMPPHCRMDANVPARESGVSAEKSSVSSTEESRCGPFPAANVRLRPSSASSSCVLADRTTGSVDAAKSSQTGAQTVPSKVLNALDGRVLGSHPVTAATDNARFNKVPLMSDNYNERNAAVQRDVSRTRKSPAFEAHRESDCLRVDLKTRVPILSNPAPHSITVREAATRVDSSSLVDVVLAKKTNTTTSGTGNNYSIFLNQSKDFIRTTPIGRGSGLTASLDKSKPEMRAAKKRCAVTVGRNDDLPKAEAASALSRTTNRVSSVALKAIGSASESVENSLPNDRSPRRKIWNDRWTVKPQSSANAMSQLGPGYLNTNSCGRTKEQMRSCIYPQIATTVQSVPSSASTFLHSAHLSMARPALDWTENLPQVIVLSDIEEHGETCAGNSAKPLLAASSCSAAGAAAATAADTRKVTSTKMSELQNESSSSSSLVLVDRSTMTTASDWNFGRMGSENDENHNIVDKRVAVNKQASTAGKIGLIMKSRTGTVLPSPVDGRRECSSDLVSKARTRGVSTKVPACSSSSDTNLNKRCRMTNSPKRLTFGDVRQPFKALLPSDSGQVLLGDSSKRMLQLGPQVVNFSPDLRAALLKTENISCGRNLVPVGGTHATVCLSPSVPPFRLKIVRKSQALPAASFSLDRSSSSQPGAQLPQQKCKLYGAKAKRTLETLTCGAETIDSRVGMLRSGCLRKRNCLVIQANERVDLQEMTSDSSSSSSDAEYHIGTLVARSSCCLGTCSSIGGDCGVLGKARQTGKCSLRHQLLRQDPAQTTDAEMQNSVQYRKKNYAMWHGLCSKRSDASNVDSKTEVAADSNEDVVRCRLKPEFPKEVEGYLTVTENYSLHNSEVDEELETVVPDSLKSPLRTLFIQQDRERLQLRRRHCKDWERFLLTIESEVMREYTSKEMQRKLVSSCSILCQQNRCSVNHGGSTAGGNDGRCLVDGKRRDLESSLMTLREKFHSIERNLLFHHQNEVDVLHFRHQHDWDRTLRECQSSSDEFDLPPPLRASKVSVSGNFTSALFDRMKLPL